MIEHIAPAGSSAAVGSMNKMTEEAQETPAHIFAYRAFRTTLFGTPAPLQVDSCPTGDIKVVEDQDIKSTKPPEWPPAKSANTEVKAFASSPIKSILLTPGATAQQRKTVTFSSLRDDASATNRSGAKDVKRISKKPPVEEITQPKDTVRRSLFQSPSETQPQKAITETDAQAPAYREAHAAPANLSSFPQATIDPLPFAETTMDLKSPKSRSGKHWKNEYQREHDRTKAEMKRLIRYSQVAKSFAAKRDAEASRMREKLDDADRKVKELEGKVTDMASELGSVRLEDQSRSQLVEDLAIQTATALKYKQKAERYRAVLSTEEKLPTIDLKVPEIDISQEEAARAATTSAGQQFQSQQDDRATALEAENATLRSTIARVKEEMQRYEERHRNWQENRRRRDERWVAKRKELEDKLAESREEGKQLRVELRDARLSSSSQESRSTPLTSQDSVDPSDPQPSHRQILGRAIRAGRGAQPAQPLEGQTSTKARERPDPVFSMAGSGSLRRQLESLKQPRTDDLMDEGLNFGQQDETLDLWGLAASSGTMSRKTNLGLLSSTSKKQERPLSAAREKPHRVDDESLWDNLRRRTSMSMMSHVADIKPDQQHSAAKADKENVNPAPL